MLCVVISFMQKEAEQHIQGVACSKPHSQAGLVVELGVNPLPHSSPLLQPPQHLHRNSPTFSFYQLENMDILLLQYSMTTPWCLRYLHEHLQTCGGRTCTHYYLVVGNSRQSPCHSRCCPPPGSWGSSRTC